jgi:hypothetical protein
MDTPYLRRQAALCLNLSQSCSDAQVAEHLDLMAAEFHARALLRPSSRRNSTQTTDS